MTTEVWMGFIRHVLTMVGGVLVAKGWLDEATWTALVGAMMTLVGVFWSYQNKVTVESKVEAALMMPPPKK